MNRVKWFVCAALAVALGCGGGASTTSESGSGTKIDLGSRKAEIATLQKMQDELSAKREELASLRNEALNGANVAASIDKLNSDISRLSEEFGERVVNYINADPPIFGEPLRQDQLDGIRLKSGEDIAIAREFIELGGDYKRAMDIYSQALTIDPDNMDLKAALADAEAKRYMKLDRFRLVKKGMTEAEVISTIGRPLMRNIRDYSEKKVSAWFFPTGEGGEAAGVFFNAEKKVYSTDFTAVERAEDES